MTNFPRLPTSLALVVVLIVITSHDAVGQYPQPRLTSLSRLGMGAGETVDVTLRGTDLEGVHSLWFDHPGLRAFHLKGTTFRVACATATPVGQHDVRVVGPIGVSNPRTFVVGSLPETVEAEPNNSLEQANAVTINSVLNGEMAAADADFFRFEGKQGQRVLIELAAERLESRLDATLHVFDPQGREVAESRDFHGPDPFLDLTFPADGRYTVKVHDVVYGGSPDHPYRLTIGDGPHLDAIVPAVAAPGVPATFTLIGRNLGGTPAPDLVVEGHMLERKTVTITPPAAEEIDPSRPSRVNLASPASPRRGFEYALELPSGRSNALFIAEATDPVAIETEPNDDEHPQSVVAPCDISGTFGTPNDRDVYRFAARKGQVWWIEATAERLGSSADPSFVVQRVVDKGVQDLASAEDLADQGAGARWGMSSVDASLRWQAPEDGTYQVVITDLYSSQRGDPRLAYRLNIRPERPDFRLFIVPPNATQVDSVSVSAGGKAMAYVIAWRADGFAGPIHVEACELPPGVRAEPVTITAGRSQAPIVFEADENAEPTVGTAVLVGRSRFGDRKEALRYVSGATPLGPDLAHPALGGGMVWPAANAAAPTMSAARVSRGVVLAVRDRAPLSLTASPPVLTVAQGHQLNLDLAIVRRQGFSEAVTVNGSDLPPNVNDATTTVAKNESAGVLRLFVPKTVPPGEYTFCLRAAGPYPFSKDPNAKQKPNINLSEPSNPVTLIVRPAPVGLTLSSGTGTLKPGASLEVNVTAVPQSGFAGELSLSLVAPPALKLSAAGVSMVAGQTPGKLVVRAAADAPAGAAAGLAVRASALVRGELIEVDEPLTLSIAK